MKKFAILFVFVALSLNNFATHIIGGETTYSKLSGNKYKIELTLFRDCFNGVATFDNPATITVFNSGGVALLTRQLILLKDTMVSLTGNNNDCSVNSSTICISKGFYSDTITLLPLSGGYTIAYQRCCRAASILNILNPNATGATYWTHIPGPEVVTVNSSPKFTITPPFCVYHGILNTLDQSATDDDGDSLSYFLANIFNGLDLCCPLIGASIEPGCLPCPIADTPPPYVSVLYLAPYTAVQPVSCITAMSIDPIAGIISLTPTLLGDYAIGVGIHEYRNHSLIGTYYRDFHMKVTICVTSTVTSTVTTTGIDEVSENEFQIFPNPADKTVTINLSNPADNAYYTLTDVSGRVILRKKMESLSENINVSEFNKGLYFLKVSSENNRESFVKKIIIE